MKTIKRGRLTETDRKRFIAMCSVDDGTIYYDGSRFYAVSNDLGVACMWRYPVSRFPAVLDATGKSAPVVWIAGNIAKRYERGVKGDCEGIEHVVDENGVHFWRDEENLPDVLGLEILVYEAEESETKRRMDDFAKRIATRSPITEIGSETALSIFSEAMKKSAGWITFMKEPRIRYVTSKGIVEIEIPVDHFSVWELDVECTFNVPKQFSDTGKEEGFVLSIVKMKNSYVLKGVSADGDFEFYSRTGGTS